MAAYLALKEIWRNRGRFLLFSLVIALITALVLFVAALAEGLGAGNRGYLEKINADLLVYDRKADLLPNASNIDTAKLNGVRRVEGVAAAAPIGFSNVSIYYRDVEVPLKVALIGVESGQPGEPPVSVGRGLQGRSSRQVIIDRTTAFRTGLQPGDTLTVKSTQGTDDLLFPLVVTGITEGRQYGLQPTLFVPYGTWGRIKPGPVYDERAEIIANVVAVRVKDGSPVAALRQAIEGQVKDVQVVDAVTAYSALPGYSAQQSTLDTMRYFALVIGILVIGGFFQIQTLQKVPQIGMLKAIGASNLVVALAAILQIIAVTLLGVGIGSLVSLGLGLFFPPVVPIVFSPRAVAAAITALMLIGPVGGLVSVRYSVRVEPLTALGLG
jgi:putative ABC transport system permease protein